MKIKIWNAFASNNSGSYVIVGSFPSEALAGEVAAELLEMARAHSAWLAKPTEGTSPLDALGAKYGIAPEDRDDSWPEHGNQEHPEVWAIGHQVFVHSDYTVTMPRLLGHVMYARGGRVQTELDHAHHAIIATFTCYIPWQERQTVDIAARVQAIVDALCADGGALDLAQSAGIPPAWRGVVAGDPPFGEGDLVIGAAFEDLRAAYVAVAAAAHAQGAQVVVHVSEAHGGDPLAYLRPCAPATVHRLVDVWVEHAGQAPTNLTKTLAHARGIGHTEARALLDRAPIAVLENVTLARATALRDALSVGNAVVTLRTSGASLG